MENTSINIMGKFGLEIPGLLMIDRQTVEIGTDFRANRHAYIQTDTPSTRKV